MDLETGWPDSAVTVQWRLHANLHSDIRVDPTEPMLHTGASGRRGPGGAGGGTIWDPRGSQAGEPGGALAPIVSYSMSEGLPADLEVQLSDTLCNWATT